MQVLDSTALHHATIFHEPFPVMIVPHLVRPEALGGIREDFPSVSQPGLFPLSELSFGWNFARLVDDLLDPEIEATLSRELDVDLSGRARLLTVRGQCRARDGRIHTDSEDKLVTALLYLNDEWEAEGGRLRFLRDGHNLEDVVAEVPPVAGTFVAFRRGENSWHGHKSYEGPRRAVMISWMKQPAAARREALRHRVSARAKALAGWLH